MGMKFLTQLQVLPWCFHLMRAHHAAAAEYDEEEEDSRRPRRPPSDPIKLIKSDGQVSVYHRPVHVSELMSEFPKHLVCHSDSFYIGQKIPALSEHDQLQLGQKYFLLPSHLFQSVLSFVTIASFVSSDTPAAKKAAAARHQLFDVQRTPSGGLRIRVSDEFISQLMEEGLRADAAAPAPTERRRKEDDEKNKDDAAPAMARDGACSGRGRVCTTARLEKEYEQLVGGSRGRRWKPKLEAIKERSEKKRGLIPKSFGIKRRKNSQSHHHLRSEITLSSKKSLPSSRTRLRMRLRK